MVKRMSPGVREKVQHGILYIAAIVFCILWLSDAIAINKRIKHDELTIQSSAGRAASFLETYAEQGEGDSPLWLVCADTINEYSILLSRYDIVLNTQKAFRKRRFTQKEAMLSYYTEKIAKNMQDNFELMEPYVSELAEAFRLLSNDLYSSRAIEIMEKIHEETYRM